MGPRDQKLTPRSRTQHPMHCQNRHWAAEVTKVRGAQRKTHRETIDMFLKDRIEVGSIEVIYWYLTIILAVAQLLSSITSYHSTILPFTLQYFTMSLFYHLSYRCIFCLQRTNYFSSSSDRKNKFS